jgi:hypothetical protein
VPYRYTGTDSRYYGDYVDASTGRMLEPVPGGGPYEIRVAPGRNPTLPLPPGDGRWHPVSAEDQAITDLILREIQSGLISIDEARELQGFGLEPEPAEVPPEGAESQPEAPEGESVPEGEPEPDSPASEATDHPEGSE